MDIVENLNLRLDGKDLLSHWQPIFVALSRMSRESTPKLGSKKQTHSLKLYRDLLKSQKIEAIHVDEIQDPPLSTDKILLRPVLNFLHICAKSVFFFRRLKIEIDDLPAVQSLLQSTTNMLRQQKGYKNKYLDPNFLRDHPSAYEYKHHDIFVPIFPRARMPGSGPAPITPLSTGLQGFVDISSKILPKMAVGHSDDDISMQNLMVVDGWGEIHLIPSVVVSF